VIVVVLYAAGVMFGASLNRRGQEPLTPEEVAAAS